MASVSIVRGLVVAWAAVTASLSVFFGAGHYFGFARDSDIRHLSEAMIVPIIVFGPPMAGLTVGVLWPWFVVMRAAGAFRRGWTGAAVSVFSAIPMFSVFFLVGRLLQRETPRTLLEDIRAVIERPQRLPVILGPFVLAGLVVWRTSGLAHLPRQPSRPLNGNASRS